jgi:hypothetical protein
MCNVSRSHARRCTAACTARKRHKPEKAERLTLRACDTIVAADAEKQTLGGSMIRPAALVMGVVAVGVAAGTYYGLDRVPPELLPKPIRPASLSEPVPKPVGGETPAETTGIRAGTDEALAKAPAEEPAVTEQDLAEEPLPPAEEPAIAPEAETAAAAPTAEQPAASEPEPAEPEVVEEKPEPAPQPAPKPAPAKPKPKAPAKAQTATAEPQPAPAPVKPKPPEADVIKPWWPNPDSMPANQLKLQYAGQVQGEPAIALLFSAPLNLETVKQQASVLTATGQAAEGSWELGKNPRLAVFRGVKPGRYTVVLRPPIADTKGFMLGTKLQGPVYVKAP